MRRVFLVALLLFSAIEIAEAQAPVAEVDQIRFHSSLLQNLHVTLYAVARAAIPREEAQELGLRRITGLPDGPLPGDLNESERAAWDAAVAFYQEDLARRDLRTGEGMTETHWALTESDALSAGSDALTDEHRRHLNAAAPVYRRYWWTEHDRAIRAWIEDVAGKIREVGPDVRPRLASLLETDWFSDPVRAEITYYGRAYTTTRPRPLTVIAMVDTNYSGWAGAEMVFHEVSHALTDPMEARIDREAGALGKEAGGLWHPVMFYLVGEVWRSELQSRGVNYEPYLYVGGLFDRAWSSYRGPIESNLRAYVDGKSDATTAFHGLIAALPKS